jgi:hypothetical protein
MPGSVDPQRAYKRRATLPRPTPDTQKSSTIFGCAGQLHKINNCTTTDLHTNHHNCDILTGQAKALGLADEPLPSQNI